jgi:hypothetical protein
MDPVNNPFAPGAGTAPPELAGRDELINKASVALQRIHKGLPARSLVIYGLRGVGKTVLLNQIRLNAEAHGANTVRMEMPEGRSLPALLAPALRAALYKLNTMERGKESALRAMKALAGFAKSLKLKYQDLEMSFDVEPQMGLADSGDLEADLSELLKVVGEAAKEKGTSILLFLDELQYLPEEQLTPLICALHKVSQDNLPVTMVAAGLPQVLARMGKAKSYAERLFEFTPVGQLNSKDARDALVLPIERNDCSITAEAVSFLIQKTEGYAYFLQEWGKHSWDTAESCPITEDDVQSASLRVLAELDNSFFRVRFDRLTPKEQAYLRAMAEIGKGPHRSNEIAQQLGRKSQQLGPIRNSLINKGMIYSPSYGDTAFTVPGFDEFMKRIMPNG